MFICPRCNYSTNRKSNLNNHFNKKKSCKRVNDVELDANLKQNALNRLHNKPVNNNQNETANTNSQHNMTSNEQKNMSGYIYLVLQREFINNQNHVYKFGRSHDASKRIKQYSRGSVCVYLSYVNEYKLVGQNLIAKLAEKFTQRKDIGTEYFEGPLHELIITISEYIISSNQQNGLNLTFENKKQKVLMNTDLCICDFYNKKKKKYINRVRVKSPDVYKDFHKWLQFNDIQINVSHKKFITLLKEMFNVQYEYHQFPDGLCASLLFK